MLLLTETVSEPSCYTNGGIVKILDLCKNDNQDIIYHDII